MQENECPRDPAVGVLPCGLSEKQIQRFATTVELSAIMLLGEELNLVHARIP